MKILILIQGLNMGGAERMACFIAEQWTNAGHSVAIVTLDAPHQPYFPLDPRIHLHHLAVSCPSKNILQIFINFWRRLSKVRHLVNTSRGDVIIGFGGVCQTLASLSALGLPTKSVAYEQTDPLFTEREMGMFKSIIHKISMRYVSAIVVQTNAARDVLGTGLRKFTSVIPNPIRPSMGHAMPGIPGPDGLFKVVALGRLNPVKGYDVLLCAWARIHALLPNWILIIHGEGEERTFLEQIIDNEKLQSCAFLPGATDQAEDVLAKANLFVLTSRTEGFPNSLCEAMAVGLPVVATNCRCGPVDIVTPEHNGLLVPVDDSAAVADAILRLASNPQRLAAMGQEARKITARFDTVKVMLMWDAVLTQLEK